MAAPKGHPHYGGGKEKGTPNKVTTEARELFTKTLAGQVEHIADSFDKVRVSNPEKYLDLFAKYAQYFVPKYVDVASNGEQVKQVFVIAGQEVEL